MGVMATSKSTTVRLRDEVWEAISEYAEINGVSQQHVASVGAWLLMCVPSELVSSVNVAFYDWCKLKSKTARWPTEVDPLLAKVVHFINEECAKTRPRRVDFRQFAHHSPDQAEEKALSEALAEQAEHDKKGRRGGGKDRGKGRKTG